MTQKNLLQSAGDGTAVPAGYVGEIVQGTLRSGTGGQTYSVQSTTSLTASASAIVSITLNKGTYLIAAKGGGGSSSGGSSRLYSLRIGGVQVSNDYFQDLPATTDNCVTITMPVYINADSTIVGLYGTQVAGTSAYNRHEITALRIS